MGIFPTILKLNSSSFNKVMEPSRVAGAFQNVAGATGQQAAVQGRPAGSSVLVSISGVSNVSSPNSSSSSGTLPS